MKASNEPNGPGSCDCGFGTDSLSNVRTMDPVLWVLVVLLQSLDGTSGSGEWSGSGLDTVRSEFGPSSVPAVDEPVSRRSAGDSCKTRHAPARTDGTTQLGCSPCVSRTNRDTLPVSTGVTELHENP